MEQAEKFIIKLNSGEMTVEEILVKLAKREFAPALLNDSNGHWAITFNGFSSVPKGDEPENTYLTFFVEEDRWKETIHQAMIYALETL